jgi:steroid 5-alpha reductase family enzyme
MADSENGGTSEQTSALERAGQVFAVFILVLLAAGIVFAVVGIYPHKIPTTKNPSFVDDIFASRVVILAVRITLLFGRPTSLYRWLVLSRVGGGLQS